MVRNLRLTLMAAGLAAVLGIASAEAGPRARDLGVPFDGTPGALNAITDVAGVEVGHTTLISGSGKVKTGQGPVRTGVTVIHPLGRASSDAVAAGRAVINGAGEWTGMSLVDEFGEVFGPIALTGTGSVGVVHQSLVDWALKTKTPPAAGVFPWILPVVGETLDANMNDVFGHHVKPEHVYQALDAARSGPVAEGNVGGGTGMISHGFKGGIGTASRVIKGPGVTYTVGVLVQANHGQRKDLRIAGVPIGQHIAGYMPEYLRPAPTPAKADADHTSDKNSLLIVIATDAPLTSTQLERLARRAVLGVGRTGSVASNFSGEFALAFSTANVIPLSGPPRMTGSPVNPNDSGAMSALFAAVVQATEEAMANQLVASETMVGANDLKVYGLPHDKLVEVLKAHGRLAPAR